MQVWLCYLWTRKQHVCQVLTGAGETVLQCWWLARYRDATAHLLNTISTSSLHLCMYYTTIGRYQWQKSKTAPSNCLLNNFECYELNTTWQEQNKKAQLSLTKPARRESLPKLLEFYVPTTLSLTILAYLHSFNCCCFRNPRNPEKFTENSNLWSARSSKVIDLGANRKPICDFILVINSNFSRVCYRSRDICG